MAVVAVAERAGGARGEAADLAGGGGYAGVGGGGSREGEGVGAELFKRGGEEVAWRRGRKRPGATRRPWRRRSACGSRSPAGDRGRGDGRAGLGRGLAWELGRPSWRGGFFLNSDKQNKNK